MTAEKLIQRMREAEPEDVIDLKIPGLTGTLTVFPEDLPDLENELATEGLSHLNCIFSLCIIREKGKHYFEFWSKKDGKKIRLGPTVAIPE